VKTISIQGGGNVYEGVGVVVGAREGQICWGVRVLWWPC